MSETLAAGTLVGERFRLDAPANDVGLGDAWIALDITNGDQAIAKFFSPAAGFDALRAGTPLAGPQVLPIRALGTLGDRPWTATDLPDGVTLSRWLDDQRARVGYVPLASVRALATALCSAMATAHRRPSPPWNVHGALSPVSVFVTFDATGACDLQLTDVGLLPFSASPPAPWGVPWFPLAPELDADPRRAAAATDVFCVAAMILEALSPRPIRDEALRALLQGREAWARWHPTLRADVDATVWALLADALQSDPRARPQTADQLARRVREARWTAVADDPRPRPPPRPTAPPPRAASPSTAPLASMPVDSSHSPVAASVPLVVAAVSVNDTLISPSEPRPDATVAAADGAWMIAALRGNGDATLTSATRLPIDSMNVPEAAPRQASASNATVVASELGAEELLRFMRGDATLSVQDGRRAAATPAFSIESHAPPIPSPEPQSAPRANAPAVARPAPPGAQTVPRWMIGAVVVLIGVILASVGLLLTQ